MSGERKGRSSCCLVFPCFDVEGLMVQFFSRNRSEVAAASDHSRQFFPPDVSTNPECVSPLWQGLGNVNGNKGLDPGTEGFRVPRGRGRGTEFPDTRSGP